MARHVNARVGVHHSRGNLVNAAAVLGLCLLLSLQTQLQWAAFAAPPKRGADGTAPPSSPIKPLPPSSPPPSPPPQVGGKWVTLGDSAVISIHSVLMPRTNRIYFVDRKNYSKVKLLLPDGTPAAATEFVITGDTGKVTRGMVLPVDPICSGGMQDKDGTIFWVGGGEATAANPSHNESMSIEVMCRMGKPCNFVREVAYDLYDPRWYPSVQVLPDGVTMFAIGGHAKGKFRGMNYKSSPLTTYELIPHPPGWTNSRRLPELWPRAYSNALYPIVHLLPSGLLFILANQRAVVFDPIAGKTTKNLTSIPPPSRTFPVAACSVLLPLVAPFTSAQVLVCGGGDPKLKLNPENGLWQYKSTSTCGKISPEDPRPVWEMDNMPTRRVLSTAILTPEGRVVVLGGAGEGTSGEYQTSASNPQKNPAIYTPTQPLGSRWQIVSEASPFSRGYHHSALLYVDGRIIVSGSNPNPKGYFPDGIWPTQRKVEAFTPPNLLAKDLIRPVITSSSAVWLYGRRYTLQGTVSADQFNVSQVQVALIYTGFSTHGLNMGQRHIFVEILSGKTGAGPSGNQVAVQLEVRVPVSMGVLPPGYYMLFLVNKDVSSIAQWIKISS